MSLGVDEIGAVVLAGGLGTRVQNLLPGIPKPMAPVAGRPFLEWVLRFLARQGVRRAVISTGYLAQVIADHCQRHPVKGITTLCVPEPAPLGTAGGFRHAVESSGESPPAWLVLNGDTLAFVDIAAAVGALADTRTAGVIMGKWMADASRYGKLALGPDGQLLRFEEKQRGAGVVNTGVYLLRPALLASFPRRQPLSFEQDVFPALTAQGASLRVLRTGASWLDIGTPESLAQAEAFVQQNMNRFIQD